MKNGHGFVRVCWKIGVYDLFGFNLWVWEHLELEPWNPGTCCWVAKPGEWWVATGSWSTLSQTNPCGFQWHAKPMRNLNLDSKICRNDMKLIGKIQGVCPDFASSFHPDFAKSQRLRGSALPCLSTRFRCILPFDLNLTIVQQIPQVTRLENPWRSCKNRWTSMKHCGICENLWES